jgi:hypothetical protein
VLPPFHGPRELAWLLISYRQRLEEIHREGGNPSEFVSDLPDEAIGPLLSVAYRASFLTEEGRPVQARLHAPPRIPPETPAIVGNSTAAFAARNQDITNTYRLSSPQPLDSPKHIARFAPTLAADDAVMVVGWQDQRLTCVGITLLDREDAERNLMGMPRYGSSREGLTVHIQAPGELQVAEGGGAYTLRANEVQIHESATFIPPVRSWLWDVGNAVFRACEASPDWDETRIDPPLEEYPPTDLGILWAGVLSEAVKMRHGGAFVVLPDVKAAPVKMKYPVEPFDLAGELRETWLSVCRAWKYQASADPLRLLDEKRIRVHKLCSAARSIGHLSGTDGCVVLDRGMTLHGFGGSIEAQGGTTGCRVRVIGRPDEEVAEGDLLHLFGERHLSAFKLCKEVPHALAFVISQDGDIRVFYSDGSALFLYDQLRP